MTLPGVAAPEFTLDDDFVGRSTFIARPRVAFPDALGSSLVSRRHDPHTPAPGGRSGAGAGSGGLGSVTSLCSWKLGDRFGSPTTDALADAGAEVDCRLGLPMTPTFSCTLSLGAGLVSGPDAVRRDLKMESFSGRTSGMETLFLSSSTMIILSCENSTSALWDRRTSLPRTIWIDGSLGSTSRTTNRIVKAGT